MSNQQVSNSVEKSIKVKDLSDSTKVGLSLLPEKPRPRGWHRFYWLTPVIFLIVWQLLRKGIAWLHTLNESTYSYKVFFPFNLVPLEWVGISTRFIFLLISLLVGLAIWRWRGGLTGLKDNKFLPLLFLICLIVFYAFNAVSYGPAGAITHTVNEVMDYPIAGEHFSDVGDLFERFNEIAPTLTEHETHHIPSHPPGPVFLSRIMLGLDPSGWLLSIFLILAGAASLWPAWALLGELGLKGERRRAILLLWLILPAVIAYTMTSFEALFSTLMLTGIALGIRAIKNRRYSIAIGAGLVLAFGGLINYSVVIVCLGLTTGAVIVIRRGKNNLRALFPLLFTGISFVGAYLLLYLISGFSYLKGFFLAAAYENPGGFRLFSQPLGYLTGLTTSIGDLWWFLWPWLGLLLIAGIREVRRKPVPEDGWALGLLSSLLLAFLIGVCRVGETARIMLFAYPFLLYLIQRSGPRFWRRFGGISALTYVANLACFGLFHTYW